MALDAYQVAILARAQLTEESEAKVGLSIPNIMLLVPVALALYGVRVAAGPDWKALQKDFQGVVPAPAGQIALTDAVNLPNILFKIGKSHIRVAATNSGLRPCDSYATLEKGKLPTGPTWYAIEGNYLFIRDAGGGMGTYVTPVSILSNIIPLITEVPAADVGKFTQTLAEVCVQQLHPDVRKFSSDVHEAIKAGRG